MPQNYKIHHSDSNSFGGGDILIDILRKRGIIEYIDSKLGKRSARAEYSYGEGFLTFFISQCRGARRFEHIYNSQNDLKKHPRFKKGMSPDTLSYMCKELAEPNIYYSKPKISETLEKQIKKDPSYAFHETNYIENCNELLIDIALKLGRLKKGVPYIFDFDTTHIENKISGSRKWFDGSGKMAYCPATGMINNFPVFIENRNGDSPASFNITRTIEKALNLLEKKGILIEMVRIDSAGFNRGLIHFLNKRGVKFVTRARSDVVRNEKEFIRNWRETTIKNSINEIGDNVFHFGKDETRIIVKKVINRKAKSDNEKIKYWGLITNDYEKSNTEILKLYAQRGDSENMFSALNEFGWKILPMRTFEHNTVYLYMTAFNYILFKFLTKLLAAKMPFVHENMKFKTFIAKFIPAGANWVEGILTFLGRDGPLYARLSIFT